SELPPLGDSSHTQTALRRKQQVRGTHGRPRFPSTVAVAVHTCGVPVRWSVHSKWNVPSSPAASPAVSPGPVRRPNFARIVSVATLDLSLTRTLGPHVLPPSCEAAKRTSQPGSAAATSRVSYQEMPTAPSLLIATAGMNAPR